MAHIFDDATTVEAIGDGRPAFRATTHPAYANMVGPYGGITAATIVRAIEQHPETLGQPLALTINYAGPIADGTWDLELILARTNRTNQHWTFTVEQEDSVAATGSAVFGIRRDTWSDTELLRPDAPPVEDVEPSDFPDFVVWARNYDKRFVTGAINEEANEDSTTTLWLRDRKSVV